METEDSEQLTKKQLFALLESAQNYMRQISTFSQKICRSQTKHSYLSVNLVRSVLDDYSMTPKKKLFALRFIKDTLILSSHCFYIFCVIKILPWIVQIFKQGDKMKDNGLSHLVQKISKTPADTQVQTISKSILQLMEQILKWTGTNINLHPFYKIKYPSAFKLYLDCFDKVKALKVTQLTFYKIQDLQRYQNQYLQEELNIQDWTQIENQFIDMLLTNTICLPLDDPEKQLSRNLLQNIVQIGDSLWIRKIIVIMKPLIQSPVTGYQSILLLHDLMKVRQIQFCIGIRNQLLEIIGYYLLMMNKETFSKTQNINLLDICRYLFVWKLVTESLGAQTKAYDELFGKLKQQWVVANQQEYQANIQSINFVYKPILKITDVNNKQKLHNFNIRESTKIWEGIKKLKYIKISQEQSQKQKQNQLMAELQKQVEQIKMKNPSKVSSNYAYIINGKSEFVPQEKFIEFQIFQDHQVDKVLEFKNLFNKKQHFNLEMKCQNDIFEIVEPLNKKFVLDPSASKFIAVRTKQNSIQKIQNIKSFQGKLIVKIGDKLIQTFNFSVLVIKTFIQKKFTWNCKARQTIYQNIPIPQKMSFMLKDLQADKSIQKYLSFTTEQSINTTYLKIKYSPMKPIRKNTFNIILVGEEEKYKITCQINVQECQIDDTIVIKTTQIDETGAVVFKLTNTAKNAAKYKGYFLKNLPQFQLQSETGVLDGYGKLGTPITVKYKCHINNRRLEDILVIETEQMYWRFKVKGLLSKDKLKA